MSRVPIAEILAAHGNNISHVDPVDCDGFRLTPNLGTSLEKLESLITPRLTHDSCIVSGHIRQAVLAEPRYNREVRSIKPGDYLFHVSEGDNRPSILKKGLELNTGGNTTMGRRYPHRVFFSINLPAAFAFVNFQCSARKNTFTGEVLQEARSLEKFDVWRVQVPADVEFYRDVLFPGQAVWCESDFSPGLIELYEDWRDKLDQWKSWRRDGVF